MIPPAIRRLAGRLVRLPLRLIPPSQRVPILRGRLRGMWWIVGSGPHGYWLGRYEAGVRRQIEQLIAPGDVFFDIGAHVGFYTLLASRLVGESGRVVAFEPLPRNLEHLRRHLAMNRIDNVEVRPVAVAERAGLVGFEQGDSSSEGRLHAGGTEQVETIALDEAIRQRALPVPMVLKIDVEGAEERVLDGARELLESHRPHILLATHGDGIKRRCEQRLVELGYEIEPVGGPASSELVAVHGSSRAGVEP